MCVRRVRIRFIKVWFWEFYPSHSQLSLFHSPSSREEKKSVITQTLDRIRERYGEEAIMCGRRRV
jgi:hypothetical protein